MTPLTGKRVNNSKKSTIFEHILLKSHDVSFEDFTILLKENNKLKLHLQESRLIKCDKPELSTDIYSYPLDSTSNLFKGENSNFGDLRTVTIRNLAHMDFVRFSEVSIKKIQYSCSRGFYEISLGAKQDQHL